MNYNPAIHHRRSIRLKGYDYSQAGWYFITLRTHDRLHLFGEIKNGQMIANDMGEIVSNCWLDLSNHYENVVLDVSVIMSNHFHGIVVFTDTVGVNHTGMDRDDAVVTDTVDAADNVVAAVGAIHESPLREFPKHELPKHNSHPHEPPIQIPKPTRVQPQPMNIKQRRNMGLSKLVGRFKMVSSKQINIIRNTPGVPVWQRNYYEHIIRNEPDLNRIREYIANNVRNWKEDDYFDR